MGIHDGHRQRLKQRFTEADGKGFDDVNLLELLLFYANARGDTNPTAHELLNRFGSLPGVFKASYAELEQVPGVGENTAILLKLTDELTRKCLEPARSGRKAQVRNPASAAEQFRPCFLNEREELVMALFLDASKRVIACRELSRGSASAATFSARALMAMAMETKADSVILAHNHPGGRALPSPEDEDTTRSLNSILAAVGITLADHLIFAGDQYLSLRAEGLFS